jgi:hypothetical protein
MDLKFRPLEANEIDCRISMVKANGVALLLYKDARCDQKRLDETVGAMNWQRHHTRDNANCIVSIWDNEKQQWIEKEDTGTESNTEKAKGLASDSFKRACFNWGIGRELYTAPFIWIKKDDCNLTNGKCYDTFTVTDIGYTEGVITYLQIRNNSTKRICYEYNRQSKSAKPIEPKKAESGSMDDNRRISAADVRVIERMIKETNSNLQNFLDRYDVSKIEDMTAKDYRDANLIFERKRKANGINLTTV